LRPLFDEFRWTLAVAVLVMLLWLIFLAPLSIAEETKLVGAAHEPPSSEAVVEPRLKGDIDESGKVDEKDKLLMEKAIGANASDPDWDKRCDLDGDGLVSFKDFLILEANMGKSLPGLSSEGSSCGFPELIFAPRIPMFQRPLNGAWRAGIKLEFRVGRDGAVTSVRLILSDLELDEREMLLAYVRGWYFETAANPSVDKEDTYSIITTRCQDIIGLEEGPLPE